jgi:hypothetical protein
MRNERTSINADRDGYTFFFQIANDGGRRACCVKVEALNVHDASALYQRKWSIIESMARDGIDSGVIDDCVITLVLP